MRLENFIKCTVVNDDVNLSFEKHGCNRHLFSDTSGLFFAPPGGKFV
jgi:hypothetical protein